MQLEHIPNQPILFEDNSFSAQPCINNDIRDYAQIMQKDDVMCVQLKITCDTSACEPETEQLVLNPELVRLDNYEEWYDVLTSPTLNGAPPTYWQSPANEARSDIAATQNYAFAQQINTNNNPVLIAFDYTFYGGGTLPDNLFAGMADMTGRYTSIILQDDTNQYKNIDGRCTLIVDPVPISGNYVFWQCFAGNDVGVKNLNIVSFEDLCINIESLNGDQSGMYNLFVGYFWMYVESVNGWQCKNSNRSLITNYQLVNGSTYLLNFDVQNLEQGEHLIVECAGVTIQTITENGHYSINYTHNTTDDFVSFDPDKTGIDMVVSAINICEICTTTRFAIFDTFGDRDTKWYSLGDPDFPVRYENDRLVWCIKLNQLRDLEGNRYSAPCGTYRIGYQECADDQNIISTTVINYNPDPIPCTYLVEGISNGSAFGFYFGDINNPFFTLKQRLRILHLNPLYRKKGEQYFLSDGSRRLTYAESTKEREAWFDYVDENTHDVIAIQLHCDQFTINGVEYYADIEDYEPSWDDNGKYNLAQSRVTLISTQNPTLYNRSC